MGMQGRAMTRGIFSGGNQGETGGIPEDTLIFIRTLSPLASGTENHLMTMMVMRQHSMHQHHDTGKSKGDTCCLTFHLLYTDPP